jgi:hypothetical protein
VLVMVPYLRMFRWSRSTLALRLIGDDLDSVAHPGHLWRRLLALGLHVHRCRFVLEGEQLGVALDVLEETRCQRGAQELGRSWAETIGDRSGVGLDFGRAAADATMTTGPADTMNTVRDSRLRLPHGVRVRRSHDLSVRCLPIRR